MTTDLIFLACSTVLFLLFEFSTTWTPLYKSSCLLLLSIDNPYCLFAVPPQLYTVCCSLFHIYSPVSEKHLSHHHLLWQHQAAVFTGKLL